MQPSESDWKNREEYGIRYHGLENPTQNGVVGQSESALEDYIRTSVMLQYNHLNH